MVFPELLLSSSTLVSPVPPSLGPPTSLLVRGAYFEVSVLFLFDSRPPGTSIGLTLTDATGAVAQSAPVTIQNGRAYNHSYITSHANLISFQPTAAA